MILGKSGITELESKNINKFGSKENKRIFINNIGFKKFTTQIGQMQWADYKKNLILNI